MSQNSMQISWERTKPSSFKPNSIYIIQPTSPQDQNSKPELYITNKEGNKIYLVNPGEDTSAFIKTINGASATRGSITLDISFSESSGILSFTNGSNSINLGATFVKVSEYNSFKSNTQSRLDSLESAVTNGLKAPKPFDARTNSSFPTGQKGDTYKVTVAGTVGGTALEVGDTLIYDTAGTTPFVIQSNIDKSTTSTYGTVILATSTDLTNGTANKVITADLMSGFLRTYIQTNFIASAQEVEAGTITNKFVTPKELKDRITNLNNSAHTHSNIDALNLITKSTTNDILLNGKEAFTIGQRDW